MRTNEATILVVDDNPENLRVVSNYLKENGYKLALAMSGQEAFDTLEKIHVDLILLDVMMPLMDGYEVCRLLRKKEKTADIPVIFLTAKNQSEDIVEGFNAGGVDYIAKPFNRQEMLARVKNHVDLAHARNQIMEMNKNRDKLYSIIAHDIKSPFSAIAFTVESIKSGVLNPAHESFYSIIDDLATTTRETRTMIDNLLSWTRMQEGVVKFYHKLNPLNSVVSDCIKLYRQNAIQKKITIEVQIPNETQAWFDEVSMHTVFRNLLANAIKFTPNEGTITFLTRNIHPGFVDIVVKDNGVGIPSGHLEKIKKNQEIFSTLGTARESGTGLGLFLVQEFVEKNQGKFDIKSTEGEGTEVIVSLPQEKPL